jgi:hypothetical protein
VAAGVAVDVLEIHEMTTVVAVKVLHLALPVGPGPVFVECAECLE